MHWSDGLRCCASRTAGRLYEHTKFRKRYVMEQCHVASSLQGISPCRLLLTFGMVWITSIFGLEIHFILVYCFGSMYAEVAWLKEFKVLFVACAVQRLWLWCEPRDDCQSKCLSTMRSSQESMSSELKDEVFIPRSEEQ